MDNLLSVESLLVERQDGRIGDDVVVEAGSERARIAQIVNLNWSWPAGKDPGARLRNIAAAVDHNVDLQVVQLQGNLRVVFLAPIVKLIERANEPRANCALVVRTERHTQDLEA